MEFQDAVGLKVSRGLLGFRDLPRFVPVPGLSRVSRVQIPQYRGRMIMRLGLSVRYW